MKEEPELWLDALKAEPDALRSDEEEEPEDDEPENE